MRNRIRTAKKAKHKDVYLKKASLILSIGVAFF